MSNYHAASAVKVGPRVLGADGFKAQQEAKANRAGHIGLGARVRDGMKKHETPVVASTPSLSLVEQLRADPSRWPAVLDEESQRPDGPRLEVMRALVQVGPTAPSPMDEETRAALVELFALEG